MSTSVVQADNNNESAHRQNRAIMIAPYIIKKHLASKLSATKNTILSQTAFQPLF